MNGKAVFAVLSGIVLSLLFLSPAKAADNVKPVRVGLALPTQQEERWIREMEMITEAGKAVGLEVRSQISRNDQNDQNRQIDLLLKDGIKVLILAPHDGAAAASAVKKAKDAGVWVIAYDRMIMGPDVNVYLSFDNVKIGELQGEYLTKLVPQGRYVLMSGAPTDDNARLFKEGAMHFIQPLISRGDIEVVVDHPVVDWQPSNARKIVENALMLAENKIDAVLAPNDGTASGAITALEAQGLAGKIPVSGMDAELTAAQRIVQGTQTFTIFKDTRDLSKKAVEIALMMVKGEDFLTLAGGATMKNDVKDVPAVLLPAHLVDRNNLDALLIDSGYLKKEDVYQ
jgi:D-xylose transport system substrate-binding protein